jgi:hypothetical protein
MIECNRNQRSQRQNLDRKREVNSNRDCCKISFQDKRRGTVTITTRKAMVKSQDYLSLEFEKDLQKSILREWYYSQCPYL